MPRYALPTFCRMLLALTSTSVGTIAATPNDSPNIVFILADDLGYKDLGCYGNTLHETPHIDALSRGGLLFTDAYAAAPSCSPTRSSVMTGKYPARLNLTSIVEGDHAPDDSQVLPPKTRDHLPLQETTLAEVTAQDGYVSCLVGKWHLGRGDAWPIHQGFDAAVGRPHSGMPKSYHWPVWQGNPEIEGRFDGEYLSDRLTAEACQFITTYADRPFFLMMNYHLVHVPIEAKAVKVDYYRRKIAAREGEGSGHHNAHYAAMVESLDDGVGRILDTLRREHVDDRTVVFFFSDNGGLVHPSHVGEHTPATINAPLRSGKGLLYEGGVRVPCLIRWPGVVQPGRVCSTPIISNDFLPTFCDIVGIAKPEAIDGHSLLPLMRGDAEFLGRDALYWHYPHFSSMGGRPSGAIRSGPWKLLEHFESGKIELYNLGDDVGETIDLAHQQPERAERMRKQLDQWRQSIGAAMPDQPNPRYDPNAVSIGRED